ncbi:hypothetical protein SAY86_022291 [Trapa natans]|uniref:Uncharacterized protein n=1 Tax=Trapa natans TaxID=22666 RepID=A0AAN7M8I1_TRANT|nr:hypothetical protein SAY86_022291 [Trapa natans]
MAQSRLNVLSSLEKFYTCDDDAKELLPKADADCPNAGEEPKLKEGVLELLKPIAEMPKAGLPEEPKAGVLEPPNAGVLEDPKAGVLDAPNAPPNAGVLVDAPNADPVLPNTEVGLEPKEGAVVDPKAGVLAPPKEGVLVAPKPGVLVAPKPGVFAAPNAGVLLDPKAGVLEAPKTGVEVAPNGGVEEPNGEAPKFPVPKAGCDGCPVLPKGFVCPGVDPKPPKAGFESKIK